MKKPVNKNSIKNTFKKWKEESMPYFTMEREGTEIRANRFLIYEDNKIKICRVEEPTFINQHENFIQVQIKNPFILFNMEIGGCINRHDAIENAKLIVGRMDSLIKKSNN